ncbi:iron chelate uptake ABC transporter family permease subunit [Pseudooceanicola nanhaiensis]|uniref:iron chelate uptake ABC transporter family permease subunit n=1 Tax=Pseudooceanicola nanhaiensis TaxID=375761 RepID=UPI001CD2DF09|nr:iron chelate uptake ABC transporter family permease subunit [Pseudooceanicola nanhaiensis]MCA0920413.1 iron chelate uptake ABC transporter family permease subunit [Pseudooceanicola nanhaiensis]
MSPDARFHRARLLALSLGGLMALAVAVYMTLGAVGSWSFVLSYRGEKLLTILLVAWAVPVSTVLFHVISRNQILTPSIMGFDALFMLIQTLAVFLIGAATVTQWNPVLVYLGELAAMVAFSTLLFRWLFGRIAQSLELLLLVGIIFGVLFRSVTGLLQRLIDPGEFLVLQDRLFASFSGADPQVLAMSAALVAAASFWAIWRLPAIDAMILGRDGALAVGVPHRRLTAEVFLIVTLLVAASTALVGPITFFGLLVANLAYRLLPGAPLRLTLPLAGLLGALLLVGAQVVLERVLGFTGTVGMVIEFLGGLLFILLLIERAR